jgi:hypothetical protein
MPKIWYLIADKTGEEIRTESEREAQTALRSGGIVTIVREVQLFINADTLVLTRVYSSMKSSNRKK